MDIYCTTCGEPWDVESLHDAVEEGNAEDYQDARMIFFGSGCGTLFNRRPCERPETGGPAVMRANVTAALVDVLGDDLDGIASELEGAAWMFE